MSALLSSNESVVFYETESKNHNISLKIVVGWTLRMHVTLRQAGAIL